MKKRNFVRFFALILVAVMCIPMLPHSADAITQDDFPVFALLLEDDEGYYAITSAFLLMDPDDIYNMYLVTTTNNVGLIEEGFEATLLGPNNFSTPATYLTTSGKMAFFYAPGLLNYNPLQQGDSTGNNVTVYLHTIKDQKVQKNGMYSGSIKLSNCTKSGSLYISPNDVEDNIQIGAPAVDDTSGEVMGITYLANDGSLAIASILDTTLPTWASLDNQEDSNSTSYSSSSSDVVSGSYSDTKFYRSNRSTYPFVFNSPLKSCYGFTLNYKITDVTKGDMTSKFKYGIYVHTTSGNWKLVKECYFDTDLDTTLDITWNSPMTIDQVAVVCYKNEQYSYTSNMTISDPVYK